MLNGLIMDYELTIPSMLRRAEQMYYDREIVTRLPDKSRHCHTYAQMVDRTKRLALALKRLGVETGDRVGTFSWNHYQHLEAYFGIPSAGGVLHTLNLRLHPNDLVFIATHAQDKVVLVDDVLWPLFEKFKDHVPFKHIVVIPTAGRGVPPGTLNYEELLAAENPDRFEYPQLDERQAATMCYTSGTTGKPKGVLASHRAIVLHSVVNGLADTQGVCERDVTQAVVPMFHANAWGLPFACLMVGAKQVFPGPHLDPRSLLEQIEAERVTLTAGVPTIWLGILQILDETPQAFDLKSLRAMVVGGSAAPPSMIQGFQDRHNLNIVHAWGMTELCPMGTIANLPARLDDKCDQEKLAFRAKQGRPVPLVEVRGRNENGLIPRDGQTMGELEVRGPWIASSYFECPEGAASFTEDGWFRTGDIVVIFPDGSIQLQDRAKDVIKSGGEWISSVALENALMGHPSVAEAAVVPVEHPKWAERPLAVVVLKPNKQASAQELIDFLAPSFAKWWLPENVEFVNEIPRTSAGKFLKSALRERYRNYYSSKNVTTDESARQEATA